MKGLFNFTINNPAYGDTEFISPWYDVSSYSEVEFIVKCDQNLTQKIEFAMDLNFQIVNTVSVSVPSSNVNNLKSIVKTRYARFILENIAAVPCELECQGFYYN